MRNPAYLFLKRAFNIVASLLALIVPSPLFLVVRLYFWMIQRGMEVTISLVDAAKVHELGTPEEMETLRTRSLMRFTADAARKSSGNSLRRSMFSDFFASYIGAGFLVLFQPAIRIWLGVPGTFCPSPLSSLFL